LSLSRNSTHSAVDDAWLTMQVFLWLNGCPFEPLRFALYDPGPANFRPALPARTASSPKPSHGARLFPWP
jgi:hypothetical protein